LIKFIPLQVLDPLDDGILGLGQGIVFFRFASLAQEAGTEKHHKGMREHDDSLTEDRPDVIVYSDWKTKGIRHDDDQDVKEKEIVPRPQNREFGGILNPVYGRSFNEAQTSPFIPIAKWGPS
jgi:hypothetical protein